MTEGNTSSLIKITYKTPDDQGIFDEYAFMPNKYLNLISAQLVQCKNSYVTLSNKDRNAIMVYREVMPLDGGKMFKLSPIGGERGFSSMAFLSEVRNITVMIPNAQLAPHGYIESAVQADKGE